MALSWDAASPINISFDPQGRAFLRFEAGAQKSGRAEIVPAAEREFCGDPGVAWTGDDRLRAAHWAGFAHPDDPEAAERFLRMCADIFARLYKIPILTVAAELLQKGEISPLHVVGILDQHRQAACRSLPPA